MFHKKIATYTKEYGINCHPSKQMYDQIPEEVVKYVSS